MSESEWNFAYAMTALLSWHVKNLIVTKSLTLKQKKIVFFVQ